MFPGPEGVYLRRTAWRERVWVPAIKAVGMEDLRVHDLRHTAVAWLIAAGEHPAAIARPSATPQCRPSSIDMGTCSPVWTLVLQRRSIVSGRQLLPYLMKPRLWNFGAMDETTPLDNASSS